MTKTNRILLALFFAQLLLLMGMRLGGDDAAQRVPSKVFEGLDPAKVTKIEIWGEPKDSSDANAPAQTSVTLTKEGTQWGLASAEGYPADATKVDEFLQKIAKLKARGPVVTRASNHRSLEVADDKYQRKITLTQEGKDTVFLLGTSPSMKNVHLRKMGSNEVLQVGELTTWEAGARAWDWVDRAYTKIPEKDVYGLRIENKNGTIELSRGADGEFSVAGVNPPIKKVLAEELVRKSSNVNLEEPVGKSEKPEYGFDKPSATITLTTGTSTVAGKLPQEMKTEVLKIGAKIDKQNRYYAKSSMSQYIVEVAGWAVDALVTKSNKDFVETPAAAPKTK